jgi:hypothetical protein
MADRRPPDGTTRAAIRGRPRHPLREQVESLLRVGLPPAGLAKDFHLPRQTVHRWRREMGGQQGAPARPGDESAIAAGRPAH